MIQRRWPEAVRAPVRRSLEAAAWSMAAVVALGPLELRHATVRAAGLTISSVELLAALAIGLGFAAMIQLHRDGQLRRGLKHPLIGFLGAWAGVHLVSALWSDAPLFSLKYGLRVTGGVSLGIICGSLGHLRRFRRIVVAGLLTGFAGITLMALGERLIGQAMEPLLQHFRDEPTWMLGEPRLSTVFYHANTLAAYLELLLPFLLVAPWLRGVGLKARALLLLWAVGAGAMLSLTYSRAGLLAGVLGSLALWISARRTGQHPRLSRTAVTFAALLTAAFLANPDMRARLGMGQRSYRVSYEFGGPCEGDMAEEIKVPLRVTNLGEWPISDRHAPGELGYLIWPRQGKPDQRAFRYLPLPDLAQGAQFDTVLNVHLPDIPGSWSLVVDIRRKAVVWLSAVGADVGRLRCKVRDTAADPQARADAQLAATDHIQLQRRPLEMSRKHYWQAALRLLAERPLLGQGADRFRIRYKRHVPAAAWDARARAHSVLLEIAADLGLLGLLILGGLMGCVAALAWPNLTMKPGASRISTAAAVALVGFGLHSLVDYFLAYTQILLVLWPIVGLATAAVDTAAMPGTNPNPANSAQLGRQANQQRAEPARGGETSDRSDRREVCLAR